MAGRLTLSTLNDDTGVLATQNGMTGIAKAWVNFNGSTSTIFASFNVSSITRNATADYTVTYTTAMPSANYCVLAPNTPANTMGTSQISMINAPNSSPFYQAPTTTTCRVSWYLSTSTLGSTDVLNASVVVIGA
jgi:hypothetical protein